MLVFVCGWRTGAIVVASLSLVALKAGMRALDEVLSDGEWELPSRVPPIRFRGSKVCLLSYTYLLLV